MLEAQINGKTYRWPEGHRLSVHDDPDGGVLVDIEPSENTLEDEDDNPTDPPTSPDKHSDDYSEMVLFRGAEMVLTSPAEFGPSRLELTGHVQEFSGQQVPITPESLIVVQIHPQHD